MSPFCPQCGVDNPANARFCDQCGAALIPVPAQAAPTNPSIPAPIAPPPQQPVTAAPAVQAGTAGLTCPQCGAAAIPGEAFCDNCGAPLNAPARPVSQAPTPPYSTGVPPQPSYPVPQPSYTPPPVAQPSCTPPPVAQPSYTPPPAVQQPAYTPPAYTPPARTSLAPAQLIVASSGASLPLPAAAQAVVGRSDPVSNFYPDVDLNPHGALDNGVGRRHVRLLVQNGQVMVEDMDSTNGTVLNGQKLLPRQPQPLRSGDQLVVGKLLLRYQE